MLSEGKHKNYVAIQLLKKGHTLKTAVSAFCLILFNKLKVYYDQT
jgi:hypothetical protein